MKIAEKSIWKYRIVYHESIWSKRCAERIRAAIVQKTGIGLQMVNDSAEPRECEIIVGPTSREESVAIKATYDRPNIYYDIKVVGAKLVCMGEGFQTLDRVAEILENLIATSDNICGEIAHGDLRLEPDGNMIDRADGTDVRVFDWNFNAPANTGPNWLDNAERAADTILRHLPDIISTNELYDSLNGGAYKRFYDAVIDGISDYYSVIKGSAYDFDTPPEKLCGDPDRYGAPPHEIIVKKNSGIVPVRTGYRYTPNFVAFHAYHWAIFESASKQKFIFTVGHYEDCRSDPTCAIAHMEAVDFAQSLAESDELLPAIITGDLFTHIGCTNGGYYSFLEAGYTDSQRCADVNCNGDITWSTYHHPGKYHPRWASIDLVFCNPRFHALKFKVITSQEALDVSDHCPVVADLKFN